MFGLAVDDDFEPRDIDHKSSKFPPDEVAFAWVLPPKPPGVVTGVPRDGTAITGEPKIDPWVWTLGVMVGVIMLDVMYDGGLLAAMEGGEEVVDANILNKLLVGC